MEKRVAQGAGDARPLDLDAIEAREKAATPGPWVADTRDVNHGNGISPYNFVDMPDESIDVVFREDAEFIAAARADVPALLMEVRRLRGVAAAERAARETAEDWRAALSRAFFTMSKVDHDAVRPAHAAMVAARVALRALGVEP